MFQVGNVIDLHNNITKKRGSVWFGKMGQTISQERIDLINNQIENSIETYLYLVKGNRRKSIAYQAKIISVSKTTPDQTDLLPDYYTEKGIQKYMNVFIHIGKINDFDLDEMENLKAISSIFSITETLELSSAGYFLVHERK